jgi:hypothetical protein
LKPLNRETEARDKFIRAIKILTPFFQRQPQAFVSLIGRVCQEYLSICKALNEAPDEELLSPVVQVFERLKKQSE